MPKSKTLHGLCVGEEGSLHWPYILLEAQAVVLEIYGLLQMYQSGREARNIQR
jgi:hypothetical protein